MTNYHLPPSSKLKSSVYTHTHENGHPVEVGAEASGGWRRVGHLVGAGLFDVYQLIGYSQCPAGHLDHFSVQSLTHFDATVRQQYGTVDVDEYQGASLVQKRRTS